MNWEECKKRGFIREKIPKKEKIESLLISSKKKLISHQQLAINEDTASSKVSLLYDSVRIALEALAIKKGYKIYNHECITCFLKEILNEKEISEKFDKYRVIRNGFNYYGEDVAVNEAKIMSEELSSLRSQINNKYFEGTI